MFASDASLDAMFGLIYGNQQMLVGKLLTDNVNCSMYIRNLTTCKSTQIHVVLMKQNTIDLVQIAIAHNSTDKLIKQHWRPLESSLKHSSP
jgi:hypothetical protein